VRQLTHSPNGGLPHGEYRHITKAKEHHDKAEYYRPYGGAEREYVPLLIIGADVPPRTDERLASFLDIGRTLLPAVGWSGRWRTWGSDLLPAPGSLAPIPFQGQAVVR
jgi:hypothetical protein